MLLTPRARVCQQSALIIALQFIPTFWLFVLPLTGAMSSGMLPPMWKPNLNNASGAAKFLCFPMVPLLLIFVVFLLAAGMVVDAAVVVGLVAGRWRGRRQGMEVVRPSHQM